MNSSSNIQISVVIPFFQKESGILVKSLNSIFLQSQRSYICEIIVVEDGSPCSADVEINQVKALYDFEIPIKLIKQANAGVSDARNNGLRQVCPTSTHIAFLDSDDRWESRHIEYAVLAINLGAKFFFSNFYQLNSKIPAFEKASNFDISNCEKVAEEIYKYNGSFINQIVISNPVGTPTVVFSRDQTHDIFFDKSFKYAGEDYMMWISLVRRLGSVYFCSFPTVICDAGVNIFSGAKWGTLHLSLRLIDEISYRKVMLEIPELTLENKTIVAERMKSVKKSLLNNTISRMKRLQLKGALTALKHALS